MKGGDSKGKCKDQHLRRQSDFYTIDDVDYIVKIEDLDKFLEKVIKVPKEGIVHNNTSPNVSLSFFHFNDEQKKFFDEYYAPDYKLLESGKVWYPEEK